MWVNVLVERNEDGVQSKSDLSAPLEVFFAFTFYVLKHVVYLGFIPYSNVTVHISFCGNNEMQLIHMLQS